MRASYKLPKLLLLLLLTISLSCSRDQKAEMAPSVLTSKQLAADTTFVRMVETHTQLTGILYGKLRSMGNDKARREMLARVTALLAKPTNANVLLAIKEMGFATPSRFVELTSELSIRCYQVEERFGNYSKRMDRASLIEAYQLSVPLDNLAQAQYWTRTKNIQTNSNDQGNICPNCHYNNCNECGPLDDPTPIDEGGGTGGGGGNPPPGGYYPTGSGGSNTNACYNNCMKQRDLAIYDVGAYMESDINQACGPGKGYTHDFLNSCFGDPSNPSQTPACQAAACAAEAYHYFQLRVQSAEDNARNCIQNCR